jgi:hypothetical protein
MIAAGGMAALALAAGMPATAAAASPVHAPALRRACSAPARPRLAQCLALVRTDVATHSGVIPDVTPAGYGPASLQSAYDLVQASALSGKGQTVALVDAFDDPDAASDLAVYRAQYGLPPCSTADGCFRKVNETGGASYPRPDQGWALEESLDLDMVSAICPHCRILLVEAKTSKDSDLGASVNEAVTLGARFVSNSYASPEFSGERSYETAYFDHRGVAVTASAGDSGYGVGFPAASRYVTAVGGTKLTADSATARGWKELVWGNGTSGTAGAGSGSGCSAYVPKPSWQADQGCADRTVADVSADADPSTGAAVYDRYGQAGWMEVGGTSEASPIIAAIYALAGAPGHDYPAKYPYEHTGRLYDVTAGSNGSCRPAYLCRGRRGYDGPTGWGTPDGTAAFRPAANTVRVTSPGSQVSRKGKKVRRLSIRAADSDPGRALRYSATGLPGGLSISPAGVISGTPRALANRKVTVRVTDGSGAMGSAAFRWRVDAAGTLKSGLSSRRCIDDRRGRIDIARCSGAASQRWLVAPEANGTVTISLAGARSCVTVKAGRTASGSKVIASRCATASSQEWTVAVHGHLVGRRSGKCLADPDRGANGTQLEIARCRAAAPQRWKLP